MKEVVLCLQSVHNVQHSSDESYYGMATNHNSDSEIPITSERSVRLFTNINSLLSVRIFLHTRGAPSHKDRAVGQVSIPVRQMRELVGPGIFQTWFLLDSCAPYSQIAQSRVVEQFRNSLFNVARHLHSPRICLTMIEATTEPSKWSKDEKDRVTYYDALLVSHIQHAQMTRAYFDDVSRMDGTAPPRPDQRRFDARAEETRMSAAERELEIDRLQQELDQLTDEANRRIERGNRDISRLKAQLKQLNDVEGPQVQREHEDAEHKLAVAKTTNAELKQRADQLTSSSANDADELEGLRTEVAVLTNQKAALMKMVQDIYGTAVPTSGESATEAANLLPDPYEFLGVDQTRPL